MELWEISFTKALELQNNLKYEDASFYFVNALSISPGNLTLIKDFTQLLNDWSQQLKTNGDDLSAFQQLERAENFIINSIPFVSPEELPELLGILNKSRNTKDDFSRIIPVEEDPREIEARKDFDLYKEGMLNYSGQDTYSEIPKKLARLQLVQEYISNTIIDDDSIPPKLEHDINMLQQALQFEGLYDEANRLISLATNKADKPSAAMILQHSESLIRQLLTWPEKDERYKRTESLLLELKKEADRISDASRKEESELLWDEYIKIQQKNINKVDSWKEQKMNDSDSSCQDQVKLLTDIMKSLQEILTKLSHQDVSARAVEHAEWLSRLVNEANILQSKRYNGWVMSKMKAAMELSDPYTGIIRGKLNNNKVELCKEMALIFGEIDTRYLTQEVNRCYSEVFEHLFRHLHEPKNEQDFERVGSKLKLLKDIFDHEKKSLNDF